MARKTEVYSWRVSPATKAHLEEVARDSNRSVAQVLDEIVAARFSASDRASASEVEQQRRLHARAARFLGRLSGGGGQRSLRARELVRARLKQRYPHAR